MRQPQQERSSATRSKVLDAAVDCLLDLGYAATTAGLVAERAGVSRGAMQYHYPTKGELLAAAVEHLAAQMGHELRQAADRLPTGDGATRLEAATDLLWSHFTTPLFASWVELAVAARTDAELRQVLGPVARRVGRAVEQHSHQVLGADDDDEMRAFVDLTLAVLSGLALARLTGIGQGRAHRAREARALALWKAATPRVLGKQTVV